MSKQILGAKLGVAYTTQDFNLGALHIDKDGNHYRFLKAGGTVTKELVYTWDQQLYTIDDAADEAVEPAANETKAACVSSVTLAANEYAFVFVGPGQFTVNTAGDVAADALVYMSTTAGKVDDTAVGLMLRGVSFQTAVTGATTGTAVASVPLHLVDSEPIA